MPLEIFWQIFLTKVDDQIRNAKKPRNFANFARLKKVIPSDAL